MKRINRKNRTKHGASTIFLAIIMSALVLVECTYLSFVWNLDYALSVNVALKTQIETVLSDYNRQLYSVYGIYAFSIEGIDNECFEKALEINGLESKSELYISGKQRITYEDLKKAINSYYWYRGTGIGFKSVVQGYKDMIIELDKQGILGKVGQFMKSPAAEYVSKILSGTESAAEWINKAGEVLNIDELSNEADSIDSLSSDYKKAMKDFGINISIDAAEWDSLLKAISKLEKTYAVLSDNSNGMITKCNASHYCAYNFDCYFRPDGDASITGTSFDSVHGSKKADCEYIITGKTSDAALYEVDFLIVHVLVASCMLKDFANEKFRNTMEVIARVISSIISAVSEGTVNIDYRIIAVGLTFYCALVQAVKEYYAVLHGQRAVIFEYEGEKLVTFTYRDFLYLFCLCVPVDTLLRRSLTVLERDYGKLYKGLTLEADYRGQTYSLTKSYQLYE